MTEQRPQSLEQLTDRRDLAISAGQVYASPYFGIQYHVLAVYGEQAWVLQMSNLSVKEPEAMSLDFLRQKNFWLKYDMEASAAKPDYEARMTQEYWHGVEVGLRAAHRAVEEGRPLPKIEDYQ